MSARWESDGRALSRSMLHQQWAARSTASLAAEDCVLILVAIIPTTYCIYLYTVSIPSLTLNKAPLGEDMILLLTVTPGTVFYVICVPQKSAIALRLGGVAPLLLGEIAVHPP